MTNAFAMEEEGTRVEEAQAGKGWKVKKEGIKVARVRGTQKRASLKLLGDTDGYTWTQIEHLLGELPSEALSNDQLAAIHQNGLSLKDKEEQQQKMHDFSKASLSTFLFGQEDSQ
eukprot:gnl/MRDRNA2_/MRDRNA2_322885_c0_seq1.p1 gnl/MRDRNA2_/MRDRNA2_322885_c0~~gnl/MRDRNA2_/MRDRNA2_322885_c0_seq1.p1  ORF type:complete len:134 (-),score=40.86 gnl/MRDRNA2_/MRDRNA2_322885_c0_seq1:90-434(-)